MTLRLRPHHLLCVLTYLGKGYTPAFVANYERIVARLNDGETIEIVEGPDDICAPMLKEQDHHCHNDSVKLRDRQALDAVITELGLGRDVRIIRLVSEDVAQLRQAFSNGALRAACQACEWSELCSGIARKNFRGCRFQPPLS
ncbi:DUF1284 domain-containing protein [Roseibium sediminis]|uniref:DUF1284 domain-containing protein n=1 Tax=Roseibium sediminis TaxID=1775174 RepID=UPI00123DD930|nr:DUF1284 domain-containing protein [Roseibium sediminis]